LGLILLLIPPGGTPLVAPVTVAVFRLPPAPKPEPLPESRTLADVIAPTNEPVGPTNQIAEENSKGQDQSDVLGSRLAPFFEKRAEFDHIGGTAPQAKPPEPPRPPERTPESSQAPEENAAASKRLPAAAPKREKVASNAPVPRTAPRPDAVLETRAATDTAAGPNGTGQSPIVLAQASQPNEGMPLTDDKAARDEALSGTPGPELGETSGQVDGGVIDEGFMACEALKSEVAPYLRQVRERVQQHWYAAMAFRYAGVSPTKAVVDCAINPDGKLVYARIVETGNSPTYAPLCKEAIDKSDPFPPFPFQVPDIYRTKNLEIRWTFSYLR
jgi:hypothetical protein